MDLIFFKNNPKRRPRRPVKLITDSFDAGVACAMEFLNDAPDVHFENLRKKRLREFMNKL
jgi:hypothetical protein